MLEKSAGKFDLSKNLAGPCHSVIFLPLVGFAELSASSAVNASF